MTMLPQSKEECDVWQQEILEKTQGMVAEEHLRYVEATAELDKALTLIENLRHLPESRSFTIDERKLALLGFNVKNGTIRL